MRNSHPMIGFVVASSANLMLVPLLAASNAGDIFIANESASGTVYIRDGGDLNGSVSASFAGNMSTLAVLSDGSIAVGTDAAEVHVRDGFSLAPRAYDSFGSGPITAMAVQSDDDIAFAQFDGTTTTLRIRRLGNHTYTDSVAVDQGLFGSVVGMGVLSNDNIVIANENTSNQLFWRSGANLAGLGFDSFGSGGITALGIQGDDDIVFSQWDGTTTTLRIRRISGGTTNSVAVDQGLFGRITALSLLPNDDVIIGNSQGQIWIRRGDNLAAVASDSFGGGAITSIAVQEDGDVFLSQFDGSTTTLRLRRVNGTTTDHVAADTGAFGRIVASAVQRTNTEPPPEPPDRAGFGKQWLREHPFQITGTVFGPGTAFDVDEYKVAGMTAVLANNDTGVVQAAQAEQTPWHYHRIGSRPYQAYSHSDQTAINSLIAGGHGVAIMLQDEPSAAELPAVAQSASFLHTHQPQMLTYVNTGDTSLSLLNDIVNTVHPDVLMFDRYPFFEFNVEGSSSTESSLWFQGVMNVRSVARANGIPYWGFLQSFQFAENNTRRVPSESDLRWNAYTLLAAGYTGLSYFVYEDAGGSASSNFFTANGSHTSFYGHATDVNGEVGRVGKVLRFLDNEDVRFVPGGASSTPPALSNWSSGAGGDSKIVGVSVNGSPAAERDGLLGLFTDDEGQHYFMLTNLYHGENLTPEATQVSFALTFANDISDLLHINRLTGEPEKVVLVNHTLDYALLGGTGELFKYRTGFFAGIPGGDANLDGDVDIQDLSILGANYGLAAGGRWGLGDFDFDGAVGLTDLTILATYYEGGQAQANADFAALVPEPHLISVVLLWMPILLTPRLCRSSR